MNLNEVVVIDYGVGNLLSVRRGFEHWGAFVVQTSDHDTILQARRVVLPGVGAFSNAIEALGELGLIEVIRQVAKNGVPLLGICLGMQLLLDQSEEFGVTAGLGLIPGKVIPVPSETVSGQKQKIPHIGWNSLIQPEQATAGFEGSLLKDVRPGSGVYFVHSYMATPDDPASRTADCLYGGHRIPSVISKDNISGCQFHPEKSGPVGLKILQAFLAQ